MLILLYLVSVLVGIYVRWNLNTFIVITIGFMLVSIVMWHWSILFLASVGVFSYLWSKESVRLKLMRPLYKQMKKSLPEISNTEKEALEAGTTWFEAEIFSGTPNWDVLISDLPESQLTQEEQSFLENEVTTFCQMIDDWQITHETLDLPEEAWDYLKQQRFFGMVVPQEYGGRGFSASAHSAVVSKIAAHSITAAVTVMVPNSLGPSELLIHYGTKEQQDYYLPRLAVGEETPCFALTGPEAGSDAAALPDYGVVEQGKDGLQIRLSINKRYITLAPVATLIGLAFHLKDPEGLLGGDVERGICCALLSRETEGLEIGARHFPLNSGFMNGPIKGENIIISLDELIGGEASIGLGWRMLMESLAAGRGISLPALSSGGAQLSCAALGAYVQVRRQFKLPIGKFEGIGLVLGDVVGKSYRIEAARQVSNAALDEGHRPAVVSAILKYHFTHNLREILTHAMDIHGGAGICMGPRNLFARAYQVVPVAITVEGANILTRNMIIFGQGMMRDHPVLQKIVEALHLSDEDHALKQTTTLLETWVLHHARLWVGAVVMTLTQGYFSVKRDCHNVTHRRQINRLSKYFALISDVAIMTQAGTLKRKEALSARLGDALSELYLASTVLKHHANREHKNTEQLAVNWSVNYSLNRAETALLSVLKEKSIGWFPSILLRMICFPWGAVNHPPKDRQTLELAEQIMQKTPLRNQLTSLIDPKPHSALDTLIAAFDASLESANIEKRLAQFMGKPKHFKHALEQAEKALEQGIVEQEEYDLLVKAATLRYEAIQVDEFEFDELIRHPKQGEKYA